jgi:nitrite reductase/ring-hydroxylating ferredoxin subunit
MAFHPIARLIDLEDGYRSVARVGREEILLICEGGHTHLIGRHCPHAGSPLDQGMVRDSCLTCPKHGVEFDLNTGRALNAACRPLRVFTPVYDGASLGIEVEST